MNQFQKNVEYFYQLCRILTRDTRRTFAKRIGISRGTFFRLINDEKPMITIDRLEKIANEYNKVTGKNVTYDDFLKEDLEKKYPIESFYKEETEEEENLFALLRKLRNTSLRQVEKLSQIIFKDPQYHLTATYVMRLERGDYDSPSINKLKSLAKIYRVPLEFLIATQSKSYYDVQQVGDRVIIDINIITNPERTIEKVKEILDKNKDLMNYGKGITGQETTH
jgi:transcriptional regulator with XRE-family HTH domain